MFQTLLFFMPHFRPTFKLIKDSLIVNLSIFFRRKMRFNTPSTKFLLKNPQKYIYEGRIRPKIYFSPRYIYHHLINCFRMKSNNQFISCFLRKMHFKNSFQKFLLKIQQKSVTTYKNITDKDTSWCSSYIWATYLVCWRLISCLNSFFQKNSFCIVLPLEIVIFSTLYIKIDISQ